MEQPAAPAGHPGRGWRGRPPRDVLLLLPAAASVQAPVSISLHRHEVIADPLTSTPSPARRTP